MAGGSRGAGTGTSPTTGLDEREAGERTGTRFLLATSNGGMRVHPLPEVGTITVGRGRACQIVLDHPSISRQHARLDLGAACTVTDLGSRNGVVLCGERLAQGQTREIRPGESFSVGPCTLLLIPPGLPREAVTTTGARLRVLDPSDTEASKLLGAVATSPLNVLIYGETGVGKELLAAALHRLSARTGAFLGINCAALGEPLLESELFGHERGAFTGAVAAKPGILQAAAGGTLLLDEIGDMSPAIQAKLLRAIETREILRVGGVRPLPIDVRFLAATHRDLLSSEDARFRKDLYYRLAGFVLEIPPLRERKRHIAGLAAKILAEASARIGTSPPALSAAASAALVEYAWPGNVRELRNVIQRAHVLSGGDDIEPRHLVFDSPVMPAAPESAERERIVAALDACTGNQTHAARMLGMSRTTLVQRLVEHRIPRPRGRR